MEVAAADEFVKRADPTFEAVAVTPLTGGVAHEIYEARDATGRSLVIKLYREELAWKAEKELHLSTLVRSRLDLPVPEIRYSDARVAVMTKLPGTALRSADLREEDIPPINRELGALLRDVHSITFDAFGYVVTGVIDPAPTNLEFMRVRFDDLLDDFVDRGGSGDLRRVVEQHVAEREDAFAGCTGAVLCHNDAHDANVLVDKGRITGILDWENAIAADPLLDLAKTHAFSSRSGDDTLAALAAGHGDLRDDWREAFELYVLNHLLELWVWFARVGELEPLDRLEADIAGRVGA